MQLILNFTKFGAHNIDYAGKNNLTQARFYAYAFR